MSLTKIKEWACEPTGYRRPDEMGSEPLAILRGEREPYPENPLVEEYRLYLKLGTRFACPPDMYERARELAAQQLVHMFYGDAIAHVREAMARAVDGDRRGVLEACSKAIDTMLGETK